MNVFHETELFHWMRFNLFFKCKHRCLFLFDIFGFVPVCLAKYCDEGCYNGPGENIFPGHVGLTGTYKHHRCVLMFSKRDFSFLKCAFCVLVIIPCRNLKAGKITGNQQ